MDTKKTRSSLRKTLNKDEEYTESARPARRISFSGKLSVRLFCKEEKTQDWDKSFEVSDHTSGDSTQNTAGSMVGASTAGLVSEIYKDDAANAVLNSFTKDNIDGSHERNSLHIENSVDFTLLPHEIINAKKQHQSVDSVMSITPLNGSENLTFLTDIEREELRTAKKSQQIFDKTADFMIDLKRATEINHEKSHHTNYTMTNMDESLDLQTLKRGNLTNYIMSNMDESMDQQSLKDLNERRKSIRQVQSMDITYGKENIEPANLSEFCIEESNIISSQDMMRDNREVLCMETDKTIQNVPPPQKTIIFNDDDIIIDSDQVIQQSQDTEGIRKQDKPKVVIRTIQGISTSSTRADLEQKRLQRYQQKHQEQESQSVQPTKTNNQKTEGNPSINQSFNCSARSSLSLDSPLIPPDCISGNCNKRKLNLRQLNDDIEHGRIQIFPNGPKTPTTDRKQKQKEKNWYIKNDSFNKSEVDMEMSYVMKTNLKTSEKKTEVTSYEVKKMSYRYSQADEANLDKTHFLAKAQIGDDEPQRTTYSPNILDMEETINDNDEDLLEGFNTNMETHNINKYPTSRKSLFFENIDMETTCVYDPEGSNKPQERTNIQISPILDRVNKLTKEASSDILNVTPELNATEQLRYRRTFQFTPGRSMIEFEDLEQKCENVSDENDKNSKQLVASPPSKEIESNINESYMSCEEEVHYVSDPDRCAAMEQQEVPRRNRQSIYKAVDIVLESEPFNKPQTKFTETLSKSGQSIYNAVPIVQEESRTCEVVRDLQENKVSDDVVPMESEGETQGNDAYVKGNNKNRKSIYKPVDIELEATCVVEQNAVSPEASLCNQRQEPCYSVSNIPEAPTKHFDMNYHSVDYHAMDFEEKDQLKVDKSNAKRNYRESTYKAIDIVLETPTKHKEASMPESIIVEASRKSRQTTYNCEAIVVEHPSIQQEKTCYVYETDTDDMRIDHQDEGYSVQNDIPNTQPMELVNPSIVKHKSMFPKVSVSVNPESLPSEGSHIESRSNTNDIFVEHVATNMGQRKVRQSIYKPIDIEVEMPNSAAVENSEISHKSRQTVYNSIPIVPETPQKDLIEIVNRKSFHDLKRNAYKNDNDKLIGQQKDRQSIYVPADIVLETTCNAEINGVKDNGKIPMKSSSSGNSRQTTYQSVPIDLDITETTHKKAENSLEVFGEPMDFEEYPPAPLYKHNLKQQDQSNMQGKYRKSIYKPVDIDIEDDDYNKIVKEVNDYTRQTICNSISSKSTTTNRRQTYTPVEIEQEATPDKSQLLIQPNVKKECSNCNISEEEKDALTYEYDFDKLEKEHKELLGSYECGKVPKSERKNQTSTEHQHNEQSTTKRLSIHLTPHLPSSKKRHTIFKKNNAMNRKSLIMVEGDTTQFHPLQENAATYSELQNEFADDSCLDNEFLKRANYLTPARRKTHASRIPILNSAKKSPYCRDPSILENSVQAPRFIQQQSRNTLEPDNVQDLDKSQEAANKPQGGAVSIFEGNPITISDVSRHFEAQKRLTVPLLTDSSEPTSENSSIEHNNRYKSRHNGKGKSLMKIINWSSDTTFFAAGNDVPTIDLLENTRISLVETLINDEGTNNEEEELQFSPESHTDSINDNLEGEGKQDNIEKDNEMPTQSLQCSHSIDPAEDSFALPQLPYWPKKAMERLRQLRSKPHIADVHEYWRRKSMEQSCVIINDSIEGKELEEEFCAANIITNYQKTMKMHRLNRQKQQQKKPAVRLPFVKRLDKLLNESCPIWIFDYQLEARNQYIFTHKKILTMSLIMNFEERDILGKDINIRSINFESNRIPKKNWEAFDYLIDYQIKLKMSLCWMHQKTLLQECDENAVLKFLCNIDNILMDIRRTCDELWNIVCMKQAQLLQNSNRTIVRKIVRTVVSKPNQYKRVEAKEFLIEIANVQKLSFKDILVPKLYFFREDIQYLPTGLNFLREFLSNPIIYLKK